MSEFDELLPAFVEESLSHLQTIEPDLLAMEEQRDDIDPEVVNRIFRGVHSIKGASGFFGFQNISRLSHIMESSLSLLREGRVALTSQFIDALLSGVDALKAMLGDIAASEAYDTQAQIAYLQELIDENIDGEQTVTVMEKPVDGAPGDAARRFDVPREEMRRLLEDGFDLYGVQILLNRDLRGQRKTPYTFINQMESLGRYIDAFLDIGGVSGLSDCLDNELAFDFLLATRTPPEAVARTLELPLERIRPIDLSALETPRAESAEPPVPEPTGEAPPEPERPEPPVEVPPPEPGTGEPADPPAAVRDRFPGGIQAEEKIRVGVGFLNELVNLAGELVLGRNQLLQTAAPLVKAAPGLNPVLQHISRVTSEMQEKIMRMRMQPISLIFEKFQRLVRDLARNHHKEIRLVTSGGDVELDKTIIEGLSDPLTHLVRNAVDHGIESPEERERAGKPRQGTLALSAYHQGGQVHLSITDDGRGIDGGMVARKALEKGVIRQEQLNEMGEKDRIHLIFRPGFSTTERITDLSGRGVGMDVVRTNIEHLGGTVEVDGKVREGTRIMLVLPLTLAIVAGLLVRAGSHLYVLPEADIDELVRVKPGEVEDRIEIVQDAWVLRLREMLLPLVHLNRVLGLITAGEVAADLHGRSDPLRILVLKHGASRFGLVVDAVVNTEEIVVKPLPRFLKKIQSFSGVSILGNGTVALILDVAGIVRKAGIRRMDDVAASARIRRNEPAEKDIQTLLLFDNGTPERFGLPLELISRIERMPAARIEQIKEKRFLQYQGAKLRLLFLEDHLPVTRPERSPDGAVGVIVPKQVAHPIGIVFGQVINTVDAAVALDTTTIMAPGLFGSAVLDGRITLLPDMYALFEMAAPEWYAARRPPEGGAGGRKRRVLLAEDTPFFRMVEKDYLTSAGYEVVPAEDGKKALEILESQRFDAVVLDIVMPRLDGWGVIRAIRSDDRLKDLPVMAVTSLGAGGNADVVQRGLDAGFDAWELKLDKTRLLDTLAEMLRNR